MGNVNQNFETTDKSRKFQQTTIYSLQYLCKTNTIKVYQRVIGPAVSELPAQPR